jgi:hypothetical protein
MKKIKKLNLKYYPILEKYIDLTIAGEKYPNQILSKIFGYTPARMSIIIKDPLAQEYVRKRAETIIEGSPIDKVRIVKELEKIAYSSLGNIIDIASGETRLNPEADLTCVQSIKSNEKGTTVQMHSKLGALSHLADIYNLKEQTVVNNNIFVGKRLFDDDVEVDGTPAPTN